MNPIYFTRPVLSWFMREYATCAGRKSCRLHKPHENKAHAKFDENVVDFATSLNELEAEVAVGHFE